MSFYGLMIAITILFCMLQITFVVSGAHDASLVNTAYYQVIRAISGQMARI